jgi:hypothetical protein
MHDNLSLVEETVVFNTLARQFIVDCLLLLDQVTQFPLLLILARVERVELLEQYTVVTLN